MSHPVVVIGAGLGGLSAAIHLRMRGFDVIVLEKIHSQADVQTALTIAGTCSIQGRR